MHNSKRLKRSYGLSEGARLERGQQVTCDLCNELFMRAGLIQHRKKCSLSHERSMMMRAAKVPQAAPLPKDGRQIHKVAGREGTPGSDSNQEVDDHEDAAQDDMEVESEDETAQDCPERPFIKTEYHPDSEKPVEYTPFEQWRKSRGASNLQNTESSPFPPYSPFVSQPDFEYARDVIRYHDSDHRVDKFLKDTRGSWFEGCRIVAKDAKQLKAQLDCAAGIDDTFTAKTFTILYKSSKGWEEEFEFTVWCRNLTHWATSLAADPRLTQSWSWHPYRQTIYHTDGSFERMIHGPMSADDLWDMQTALPPNAHLFGIKFYSDKTDFGRWTKLVGYPVLGWVVNLNEEVQNSSDSGGYQVLGYLPAMPHRDGEKETAPWTRLKREVYHQSVQIVFGSGENMAARGVSTLCGDHVRRDLRLRLPIELMDLEEQWTVSLTRGKDSNFPCPQCLVPNEKQYDLSGTEPFPLRTQHCSEQLVRKAQAMQTTRQKGEANELLKAQGLYAIDNAWWRMAGSDIHKGLSFDILHTLWLGLWSKHLFELLKGVIKTQNWETPGLDLLDQRINLIPRYPGLRHFSHVAGELYPDGKQALAILQCILPCTHDLVPKMDCLFRAIRLLACICMLADMPLQTTTRLEKGQALVEEFGQQLQAVSRRVGKNFNFPKTHQLVHLFPGIWRKGAATGTNTIMGESKHGIFKKSYKEHCNKWPDDTPRQIMRYVSHSAAIRRIEGRINAAEAANQCDAGLEHQNMDEELGAGNFQVGSPDKWQLITEFLSDQEERGDGPVFDRFRTELNAFLAHQPKACRSGPIVMPHHKIRPFRYLKLRFMSVVDFHDENHRLRCTPQWRGESPRYDVLLVHLPSPSRPTIARLRAIFQVNAFGHMWIVAYVTQFRTVLAANMSPVGQPRVEENVRGNFILLEWAVRAAHLCPSFQFDTTADEALSVPADRMFYVNDLIDPDMYLRLEQARIA